MPAACPIAPIEKENSAPYHTAYTMFRASGDAPKSTPAIPQTDGTLRIDIGSLAREVGRAFRDLAPEQRAEYQRRADEANAALAGDSDDPDALRAR